MAEKFLQIGEDKPITLTILDSAGVAYNLTGASVEGYAIILYYPTDDTIIQRYSENTVTGYNTADLDKTNEATGILVIDFQRALSELGRDGAQVRAKIIIQLTDADYVTSQQRTMTTDIYVFTFKGGGIEETVDLS